MLNINYQIKTIKTYQYITLAKKVILHLTSNIVVGNYQKQYNKKLIPTIIQKVLNNENTPIYRDDKNIQNWLYPIDTTKIENTLYWKNN
jgi:dTDP-D-glucose 4,6-dehydratase